jgi:isoleucyl-tRNA synthetase
MKAVGNFLTALNDEQIQTLETNRNITFEVEEQTFTIAVDDVEIIAEDVPGWQVTNMGRLTVALDVTITQSLKEEGIAREVINRIQNLRKDKGFEVTDKISVVLQKLPMITDAVSSNLSYICEETLAESLILSDELKGGDTVEIEETQIFISLKKN